MTKKIARYIKIDQKIHSGMPVIAGTRVTVAEIIDYLQDDKTVTDVIKALKKAGVVVTRDEVVAALDYAKFSTLNEAQKRETFK